MKYRHQRLSFADLFEDEVEQWRIWVAGREGDYESEAYMKLFG